MAPGSQAGQAIVLIAIMLAVVVGMAALAIDGSRAYTVRRDLQAAVDAAALAAGDKLQQTNSYVSAEQAASTIFGTNLRLYLAPTCSPAYASPGASPLTVTCTYSDGSALAQTVSALGPQGSQFTMTGTRALGLEFARILTSGAVPRASATASSGVNNLLFAPTLAALNQAGCGGTSGAAFTVTTGGTMSVVGDVVSNGVISSNGSLQVAGDVYARCQSSVSNLTTQCYSSGNPTPCTYPDVAGAIRTGHYFADPAYPPPTVTGGSQPNPGDSVVLSPGVYAVDPLFPAGRCYFLAGGVYEWLAGYTNNAAFVSNELKPPDEPTYNNNTNRASHQFWDADGVHCAGAVKVTSLGRSSQTLREGNWAIVVTAVRTATFNGLSYKRESAPSECHTVVIGDNQVMQVQISNVPGATSYNVYAAPPPPTSNGCSGPFGLAGSIASVGTQQNDGTGGCAFNGFSCSLGTETVVFDATLLGLTFSPTLAAPGVVGSYPPSGETAPLRSNLPNENANLAAPPAGDRANENQCDTVAGALTTCPGPITPGAVEFYIPSGGCLNDTSNADNYVFSGYQYDWIALYEPGAAYPPANVCSNTLGAATDSAFIGLVYTPAASITVNKASAFRTDEGGGVIAYTLTFSGQLPTIIGDTVDYGPVPQASRLIG
jgi:Putative Flp pilus-assembly TadE/G-like